MILHHCYARAAFLLALVGGFGISPAAFAQGLAGPDNPPPHVPGRLLVQFSQSSTADQVRNTLNSANAKIVGTNARLGVHTVQLPAQANEMAVARAFARRPGVVFAELDVIHKHEAAVTTNDPYLGSEWHINKIGAPTAWSTTRGSASVIIAILDTGCDPTHPDLMPQYVPGWNMYDNNSNTADVYGHGTAVAGTAAAAANNGVGVAGVAGGCRIMPIRISDAAGSGYSSLMANGLTWAADHGARVANISYQMTGSSTVTTAAKYFMSKGGVVTISAGNYSTVHTAPDNPYVLTVSALAATDTLASFSDSGSDVDVAAPGSGIYTTCRGGGYGSWSGTSFSAPVTAGVAALVISANPNLTGAQVQDIIKQSADDLGAAGWDTTYAAGRVNAAQAVSMALSGGTVVVAADTTPPTVDFGNPTDGGTIAGNLNVNVNAADNLGVSAVALYLDGVQVASSPGSPFTFGWNTNAVANGIHNLRAVALDSAGNSTSKQISVSVANVIDTTAPVISISAAIGGSKGAPNISASATVSDNVGVVKVELWIDGILQATDTSAPWTFAVNTKRFGSGFHSVVAKAYDAAGNATISNTVSVKL